jgi:hypothetical protein
LNPHQQRKMSNQAMVFFHPFFSVFSSNFLEFELCRVDVDRFCFRCKRKFSFYSTED